MSIIAYDLATEEGDFIFKDGDFNIVDSNQEHAAAIMVSNVGEWKQTPNLGVNINSYLNSPGSTTALFIEQKVAVQLKADGFKTQDLKIEFDLSKENLTVKTNAIRIR